MGTEKRERQKAGRQIRLEQARASQARKRRSRRFVYAGLLVVVLIAALFVFAPDDDDDDDDTVAAGGSTPATESIEGTSAGTDDTTGTGPEGETASTVPITIPAAGATIEGDTPCPAADGSAERTTTFTGPPPMCIDTAKTYTAELVTTEGTITIELDDEAAPETVNNFVVLARYHYYDGIAFHRIIRDFMVQAGDAVGPTPGTGGPGYTIPDELPTGDAPYPEGSLAMANTGEPNSGGSQWFITVGTGGDQLSPTYSRFGSVTSGIEVVRTINQYGESATNGAPTNEVLIESVTITEA